MIGKLVVVKDECIDQFDAFAVYDEYQPHFLKGATYEVLATDNSTAGFFVLLVDENDEFVWLELSKLRLWKP